jgi:replicative DNA helicase
MIENNEDACPEEMMAAFVLRVPDDTLNEAEGVIAPSMFENDLCRRVWETCSERYAENKPCTLQALRKDPRLKGCSDELRRLRGLLASTAHLSYHISDFIDLVSRRRLMNVAKMIDEQITALPAAQIIDSVMRSIGDITSDSSSAERRTSDAKQVMLETLQSIEESQKRGGKLIGYATGISKLDRAISGLQGGRVYVIAGRPAKGKCHSPDDEVIMFDGSIKTHRDLVKGDVLVDMDGNPTTVLDVHSGTDQMYNVEQRCGVNYSVNSQHLIPSYCCTNKNSKYKKGIHYTKAEDWEALPARVKHAMKGARLRGPIKMQGVTPSIEPYLLGVWLGDGVTLKPQITNCEPEIGEYLLSVGCRQQSRTESADKVPVYSIVGRIEEFRGFGLLGNKHIPQAYLVANLECRKQLLAGILDTDGYLSGDSIEITQKSRRLIDDIKTLVVSLGGAMQIRYDVEATIGGKVVGKYHRSRVFLPQGLNLPLKVPRRRQSKFSFLSRHNSKISVSLGEVGGYCGVSVDSPSKTYLLSDGTVTHNSVLGFQIASYACRYHQIPTVMFSLEMSNTEIGQRMLASESNVEIGEIMEGVDDGSGNRAGSASASSYLKINQAAATLAQTKMLFRDYPIMTALSLRVEVRKHVQKYGVKVVLIDYLQLFTMKGNAQDRRLAIGEVTKTCKQLAKQYEIAIILISQLNRDGDGKSNMSLNMLSDSDEIGRDADCVMCLNDDQDLDVIKNRSGATGFIPLDFDGPHFRFTEGRYED